MPMTPENATWFADAFSTIVNNVGQALLDKEDDDAADDADCADAGVPEDVGAAAEEVDAPDRPAEPGRAWRAGFCDVV